jgi:hypothetical protein
MASQVLSRNILYGRSRLPFMEHPEEHRDGEAGEQINQRCQQADGSNHSVDPTGHIHDEFRRCDNRQQDHPNHCQQRCRFESHAGSMGVPGCQSKRLEYAQGQKLASVVLTGLT